MRFRQAFTTVAIAALLPLPALADELSESRVKELVLEAIRENPEIVMEAGDQSVLLGNLRFPIDHMGLRRDAGKFRGSSVGMMHRFGGSDQRL